MTMCTSNKVMKLLLISFAVICLYSSMALATLEPEPEPEPESEYVRNGSAEQMGYYALYVSWNSGTLKCHLIGLTTKD